MAAAFSRTESDNGVYRMLQAARRIYPGVASCCYMDSKMLCGGREWPSSLCWNVVGPCCEIQSAPSLSRYWDLTQISRCGQSSVVSKSKYLLIFSSCRDSRDTVRDDTCQLCSHCDGGPGYSRS